MPKCKKKGTGVFNTLIDRLPVELHLPGYQFCGPGTRLKERLDRGEVGINPLDAACKEHDIAYEINDLPTRHRADRVLASKAWHRVKAKNTSFKERAAALLVAGAMKAKLKMGMGIKKRKKQVKRGGGVGKVLLKTLMGVARNALKNMFPSSNLLHMSKVALEAVRRVVRGYSGRVDVPSTPVQVPKTGGFLPLIPLFAGLSALGGLAGGAAGIASAVSKANAASKQLQEAQRHNQTMEALALRGGKGLYLAPYKRGLGLYLNPRRQ